MASVRPPFVLGLLGTSLTTGRLSADWVPRLLGELKQQPEAVGPIILFNMGRGSQTSDWGVTQAPEIARLNPSHVLMEGFAINDSVVTGGAPAVTRANHIANIANMVATFRAANPAVDITIQTMNPVSSSISAQRPDLQLYYDDEIAAATTHSLRLIDNYYGMPAPGYPGGWPKPLPDSLTYSGDGLHPVWQDAVSLYLFQNILWWARERMAEYWGLPAPTPPPAPAPMTLFVEMIGGGGGGGGGRGGAGGGAGGVGYFSQVIFDFNSRPIVVGQGGAGALASDSQVGANGTDTTFSGRISYGGGAGGAYSGTVSLRLGRAGGSGGGGGVSAGGTSYVPGGSPSAGQGNSGGAATSVNSGAGGGGGAGGAGGNGASQNGGDGGPGAISAVPGSSQKIAPGAPGGSFYDLPGSYAAGFSQTSPGAGGRGGSKSSQAGMPGTNGQMACWYIGPPRATGGVISSFGGYTIHTFTGNGFFQLTS